MITHFAKYFFPDHGGMETVVRDLVELCAQRGLPSRVIAYGKPARSYPSIPWARVRRCRSAVVGGSAPVSWSYWTSAATVGPGVAHLHAPNPIACSAVRWLPRDVPLVITHHADSLGRPLVARISETERRYAYERARCIVATSDEYAAGSAELTSVRRKIVVVPLGIADPTSGVARVPAAPGSPLRVIAVGRLVAYKGFDVLLDAFAGIPSSVATLRILGDGPERDRLVARASSLPHVRILGRIDDAAKASEFASADVLCLPSRTRAEAFGVAILEAFAHGLAVITTRIGSGNTALNIDHLTGRNVPPDDAAALRDAIEGLARAPNDLRLMSAAARERFLSRYQRERMGDAYLDIYRWAGRRT